MSPPSDHTATPADFVGIRSYLSSTEDPVYTARPAVIGKLDAHKVFLSERVAAAHPDRIPATVLLSELRLRGYTGAITIPREHLASLRPVAGPNPGVRLEIKPGRKMQADWAVIRRSAAPLSVFVAVLGHSRMAYVQFVTDEQLETLMACHEAACTFFGGTPHEVLCYSSPYRGRIGSGRCLAEAKLLDQ